MSELVINVGFKSNAQTGDAQIRQVRGATENFSRFIIDEVAVNATEATYRQIRDRMVQSIRAAVLAEVSKMALTISRNIALADKYTGPHGQMTASGARSQTARQMGMYMKYNRQDTRIKWPKRSKKYLARKAAENKPARWWKYSGDLAESLSSPELYLEKFGPVHVIMTRPKNQGAAHARMEKAGRGVQRITTSSTHGRPVNDVQLAKIEVVAFGRITPAMIPGLATPLPDPSKATPADGVGLARLIGGANDPTRIKLAGRAATRRFALEPFVSFYLTRAIPNAIWRRIEAERMHVKT